MCNLVIVVGPHLVCIEWLLPIGGVYSLGVSIESHLIPLPSLHDGEGSSFPGLVPSDDTVNSYSVMHIKPGDSGVVIWVSG